MNRKMKITRFAPSEKELRIEDITLLSVKQYQQCRKHIPWIPSPWWLRDGGKKSWLATYVDGMGGVNKDGRSVTETRFMVRPALKVEGVFDAGLQVGDKFTAIGQEWTVISETLVICNEGIVEHQFAKSQDGLDANEYEKSAVKQCLKDWLTARVSLDGFTEEEYQERSDMPSGGTISYNPRYGYSLDFAPRFQRMLSEIWEADKDAYFDMWEEIKNDSPVEIEEYGADGVQFGTFENPYYEEATVTEGELVYIPTTLHEVRRMIVEAILKTHKEVS